MYRFFLVISTLLLALSSTEVHGQPGAKKLFISLTDEGNLGVIEPASGRIVRRIQVGRKPVALQLNADGSRLYVSNTASNNISIVDPVTDAVATTVGIPITRRDVFIGPSAYSAATNTLYVAEASSEPLSLNIYVLDCKLNAVTDVFDAGPGIVDIAVSRDGSRLYVAGESAITVYSAPGFSVLHSVSPPPGHRPTGVAVHPSEPLLAATYGTLNKVVLLNTENWETEAEIEIPERFQGRQDAVIFSPDGSRIFVATHKTSARGLSGVIIMNAELLEMKKYVPIGEVKRGMAVSPDGLRGYFASDRLTELNLLTYAEIKRLDFRRSIGCIVAM